MGGGIKFAAMALLCAAFLYCGEKKKTSTVSAPPRRDIAVQAEGFIVKTKSLSENLEVSGTLMPYEVTAIRSEIPGRVIQLNIPEGRFVQKGALLAKLFDGDLQAQLKKLQVQLEISEKTAERYRELLKIGGISQQEYDLSQLQVNNLRADIQLVRVDIGKTAVRAPYAGRVGLKNISVGAYITPTDIITTISQVSRLKMEFTVPEKYSDMMKVGKSISFTVVGTDRPFNASIMATESNIQADTRTLKVRAVVSGNHPSLVPGAFAKVILRMEEDDDALIVPTQAIIPQARNKKVIVYRAGAPEFQTVTTGIRDSSFVQIVDGLSAGDTVLTTALLAIRPESKVQLTRVQ